MISTRLTSASAGFLLIGGLALLFASDVLLPCLHPELPASSAWLGQLVAAAWLAIANLNWWSRSVLLGGIYGRPLVLTNSVLYFITAMVVIRSVTRPDAHLALWLMLIPTALFAVAYAWLLFRGPLEGDVEAHRRAHLGS